jgi:isocitrate dehydrogenase (NAD+)
MVLLALIIAWMMLLDYLGEENAARHLEKAVAVAIAEVNHATYGMKADCENPTAVGTKGMADAIVARMSK